MSGDDKKSHRGLCKDLCFKVLVAFNSRHLQLPGSDYSRKLEAAIDALSIHTLDNELGVRIFRYVKTHLSARHALEDKGGKPSITKELRLGLEKMLEYVTSDQWKESFAKFNEDQDKLMLAKACINELLDTNQQLRQQLQQLQQLQDEATASQSRKRRQPQGSAQSSAQREAKLEAELKESQARETAGLQREAVLANSLAQLKLQLAADDTKAKHQFML